MGIYQNGIGITRLFFSRAFVKQLVTTHYRPYGQQRSHHYVPIGGNLRIKSCVEGWVPYKESWRGGFTLINHVSMSLPSLSAAIGHGSLFPLGHPINPSAPPHHPPLLPSYSAFIQPYPSTSRRMLVPNTPKEISIYRLRPRAAPSQLSFPRIAMSIRVLNQQLMSHP